MSQGWNYRCPTPTPTQLASVWVLGIWTLVSLFVHQVLQPLNHVSSFVWQSCPSAACLLFLWTLLPNCFSNLVHDRYIYQGSLSHLSSWPSWCSRTLSKPFSGMWCHSLSLSLIPSLITATLCPATIQIADHSSTSLTNLFLLSYSLCWKNCLLCGFNQIFPSTKLIWLNAPALWLHERDLESR